MPRSFCPSLWVVGVMSVLMSAVSAVADTSYTVLQDRPDRLTVELPNRLIVIAQEMHATPVVSTQVWVKTGSIYEQEFVGAGLSHFLEHLLSGGTTSTRSEEESNAILGRIGAQVNAQTGLDTVHYYINTTKPFTADAIDLLSDWMQHTQITEKEYQRERDVIQKEFAMGEGEPSRLFWKLTQIARYQYHPARHPTIGYLDEYLRVSREQITDFYHRMYAPNNLVFVVVGDIDKKAAVDQVAKLWAGAKTSDLPTITFPAEPKLTQIKESSGVASIERPQLRLAWPGTRVGGEHDYALDLLAVALGQGESSRLVETVRDQDRLVNTVDAYNLSFPWGEGYFGIDAEIVTTPVVGASTQPAKAGAPSPFQPAIDKARAAILAQVVKIRDGGVTADELARAKRQTIARVMMANQAAEDIADRLAGDLIGTGDPDYLRHYADAIEKITPEQVKAAAQAILDPAKYIAVTMFPLQPGQEGTTLSRPKDSVPPKDVARETVVLDNIKLVEKLKKVDAGATAAAPIVIDPVQRFTLSNGLRVLVGRSTLVPAVTVQMYTLGGLLADEPGKEGVANAMCTMLMRGTTTRTAPQIAREVEDLGADLSTESGNNTHYAKAVALKEDWKKIMALLADVTLNPSFNKEEWGRVQPRLLAAIERQNDNWGNELRNSFRQAYFGDAHQWSKPVMGRRDIVAKLTTDDLAAFHREHLGASQAVLAVFGDVDPKQVVDEAEKLFGGMPKEALAPVKLANAPAPHAQLLEVKTDKALAAVQVGYGPGAARNSPDYPSIEVLCRVLSSFPSGWLENELRGRGPGLVYAVSAGQMTGAEPGYLAVMFNTQPNNAVEALTRAAGVVARARNQKVDASTLDHAKAAVLAAEFLFKQTLSDRAADAALAELYGLPLDEPERFLKDVQAVTPEALQLIAQTYLRNPVAVVLTHQAIPEEQLKKAMAGPAATQPAKTTVNEPLGD